MLIFSQANVVSVVLMFCTILEKDNFIQIKKNVLCCLKLIVFTLKSPLSGDKF